MRSKRDQALDAEILGREKKPRKKLTAKERSELLAIQGGTCCVSGCESTGPFHAEHSTPHVWRNEKPDQLMCVPCHKEKTQRDIKAIAKVKRIRRKAEGPAGKTKKIRSRGFPGHRKFNGTLVLRDALKRRDRDDDESS